jgi:NTP pyrophosphatase (non-canonical NTP hydrolase)
MSIEKLVQRVREFRDERDWRRFHTPEDLAAAIAIEAGELQEVFLWKSGSAEG